MRKLPKVISLFLAGLMAISSFGMSVLSTLAATVDSAETGAIMTEEERIAEGHELVYFQFPEKLWGPTTGLKWSTKKHTVNVCCQFYAIYGNEKEVKTRSWQAPSTNMLADEKPTEGGSTTFYFDITESEQIAGDGKLEDGVAYGILFSTKANADNPNTLKPNTDGYQTCDLYFDKNCVGDTYVIDTPAKTRENTQNSQKIDYYAHSLNGIGKPIRKISTLCAYLDGMGKELDGKTQVNGKTLSYLPDSLETANRLHDYLAVSINEPSFKYKNVKSMMDIFETNAVDVYWMYDERFRKDYSTATQYEHTDGVEDQNADGSMKDCYRFKFFYKPNENPSLPDTLVKIPNYDLVAERLNLIEPRSHYLEEDPENIPVPKQVKTVDLTLDGENVNIPNDANYTVNTEKKDGKLVTTVSPKSGYAFTAKPVCNKTGFSDDTTVAYDNNKTYIDAVDGKIIVTTSAPEPSVEPISKVNLDVNSDDLAAGKAAPAVDAPAGANYTVNAVWTPEVDDTFAYDTEYTLTATYTANDGYCFNEETEVDSALENVSKELKDGKLVVTYSFKTGEAPSENTYLIAGDQTDIFGTSWDANNADNTMTKNEDGTYTKAYIVEKSYLAVQLKVVKNGEEWIGDESGDNKAFSLSGPGTFTVKFTPATQTIEILGDIVGAVVFPENPEIYAVGNGEGTWLNGINWDPAAAVNKMTEVEEDVWEIKYENVPDGFDRQVKFAVNGAWTFNFGAPKEDAPAFESGKEFDAAWDGGNITFDTEDNCNITVRLDLRNFDFISKQGAKYTITIEPIVVDIDGDGEWTIADATLIQRYLVGSYDLNEDQLKLADFDKDGEITIRDVTCIQRYIIGMYTPPLSKSANFS